MKSISLESSGLQWMFGEREKVYILAKTDNFKLYWTLLCLKKMKNFSYFS